MAGRGGIFCGVSLTAANGEGNYQVDWTLDEAWTDTTQDGSAAAAQLCTCSPTPASEAMVVVLPSRFRNVAIARDSIWRLVASQPWPRRAYACLNDENVPALNARLSGGLA